MRSRATDSGVRLAELMAALSIATDLGMGQPLESALRSCVVAMRLGETLDLNGETMYGPAGLSEREVEVLRLLARGHSNRDMAVPMHLDGADPRRFAPLAQDSHAARAQVARPLRLAANGDQVALAADHDRPGQSGADPTRATASYLEHRVSRETRSQSGG